MDSDYGIDLGELERVIEEADVIVLRFHVISQRLLIDARSGNDDPPVIRMVPPAHSAEERYRYLQEMRPDIDPPDHITVAAWPRYVQVLKDAGLWRHIVERLVAIGGPALADRCEETFGEIQRAERAEVSAAILGGEGYESLWERTPSR